MRLVAFSAAILALVVAEPARADWNPGAELVSVSLERLEQGDDATSFAAVTPDGRYVVFQTRARNFFADDDPDPPGLERRGGIFRFDRQTGALALVADGDLGDPESGETRLRGAANPSISGDGRFVAFSSAQQLVASDANDNIDVYVRDLSVPLTGDRRTSGAFELVSARDGGTTPATYQTRATPLPGRNPGAEIWAGTSISADGNYVAFRTVQPADLPAARDASVPAGQLFVRDRSAQRTHLLTNTVQNGGSTAPGSPAGGATGPFTLSGDGSTVSWVGTNAGAQTKLVNGESVEDTATYYLWKRWAVGGATRRITGIADPDDPACGPSDRLGTGQNAAGACDGPLAEQEAGRFSLQVAPALSADGYRVAYLAAAARRPVTAPNNPGLDLFTVDMSPGQTLKSSTRELTRDTTNSDLRVSAPIDGVSLSADGSLIGFTTNKTLFTTTDALRPVGTFRGQADERELYSAVWSDGTLERVVTSFSGADQDGSVLSVPSLSRDGSIMCFAADSANLAFGDANATSDAFCATRPSAQPPPTAPPDADPPIDRPPVDGRAPTRPRLGVRVTKRRDGALLVRIRIPGAGRVAIRAHRVHKREKRGGPVVASGVAKRRKAGEARVVLRPNRSWRRAVRGGVLRVRVDVVYRSTINRRQLKARVFTGFGRSPKARERRVKSK